MAIEIPDTLEAALDPAWLSQALAQMTGGKPIREVVRTEVLRSMASKVRIRVFYDGGPADGVALCLKAGLDMDELSMGMGATCLREGRFYREIAPHISVRTPPCVAVLLDETNNTGFIIMDDLIEAGAKFCGALEPLTADDAAKSLEQLARLHVDAAKFVDLPWIDSRINSFASRESVPQKVLQEMMDGPRGDQLPARTRDMSLMRAGLKKLAELNATLPQGLVHGDAHAGNLYRIDGGFGYSDWQLLQRGNWALDISYHMAAVLPREVAEREEERLLRHYLDAVRAAGGTPTAWDAAWFQYRVAPIYGFNLWAITRRVDPAIVNEFCTRIGGSVTRHDSYGLLGL